MTTATVNNSNGASIIGAKARLIGESSAGMTAVEIYDHHDDHVWSYRWFDVGASGNAYAAGLCEAMSCMMKCGRWADFEDGLVDDDGSPFSFGSDTTGVMLEYHEAFGWRRGPAARSMGRHSTEIIDALMLRGLIDDDDLGDKDSRTVKVLATHRLLSGRNWRAEQAS